MKFVLIVASALVLTACATSPVPVVPKPVEMPALPAPLNQRAQPLPPLTSTDLHGHMREGVQSDRLYNDLRDRHNAVLQAWSCVREALLDRKDGRECFR